jgi:uncharacterized metal-binding protein YceD (DUF177 family)
MKLNTLSHEISLSRIPSDSPAEYELDKHVDWVEKILRELNENATYRTPEMYLNSSSLDIKLSIKKKYRASIGEIVLIRANIAANYFTQCVKTLNEMKDQLLVEFKAAVIDANWENTPEYQETTEIFEDNDVHELYFYEKQKVNLYDIVHEQIYLNYDQYPTTEKPDDPQGMDNLQ